MKKMITPCITSLIISSGVYAASSKDLVKSTQSWNGTELPSINLQHPQVTIKEITIAPGERLPVHLHPVINAGILLEGKLMVYSEDRQKVLQLEAGTEHNNLIEMVNQYHYGVNNGSQPAKIVVFYISEKDGTVTKLKH
jgi:quercetin dioxygenase-like cupin family protein